MEAGAKTTNWVARPQHTASPPTNEFVENIASNGEESGQSISYGRDGMEDWIMQGVDVALFDSFIRGSELDLAEA